MSGAELPIAAVSFFFQAFAGCIQGYELISDACRLEKNAEQLLVNFKLEKHRFINWAKLVQLDYTEEHLTLNHMSRGMVMDVMNQQEKLFASFGRLDARYKRITLPRLRETDEPFEVDSDHLLENGTSTPTANSKGKAVQFPVEDIVKKALDWLSKSRTVPKRLRWASFDKEKMESLISKLSTFNDKMKEALDQAQMESLYEMQTRTNYQIVLLNRHMDNMVQIFQAQAHLSHRQQGRIYDMEDSEYDFLNGIAGLNMRRQTQPLDALAQQKYIHLAIEDSHHLSAEEGNQIGLPHLAQDIVDNEISFDDITDWIKYPEEIEEGERTEAKYRGNSVWIEWKPNETAGPGQPDGQVDPKIRSRVTKLAALLKQNNRLVRFRAPHCLGYFVDDADDERESRFGLVFEKPANVPEGTKPTSLRSLIEASNTANPDVEIPSLTDRVTLMRLLAETVERLHAVDWLHKGLRSSNILFFETVDSDGNKTINYADPYVSGFDYSRPATSDELTERPTDNPAADIYRHPIVQSNANREESSGRESYKKSYDLYSLGIVLLEIAYWKTIDQILGIDIVTARPKQTWPVKERLLTKEKQHLRLVKSNTGNTVESVIRACLEGPTAFGLDKDCDEKRDVVAAHLQTRFGELVVKKLASMKGL